MTARRMHLLAYPRPTRWRTTRVPGATPGRHPTTSSTPPATRTSRVLKDACFCGDSFGLQDNHGGQISSARMFEDFARLVVPGLQRRTLFRRDHAGATLRQNLASP